MKKVIITTSFSSSTYWARAKHPEDGRKVLSSATAGADQAASATARKIFPYGFVIKALGQGRFEVSEGDKE